MKALSIVTWAILGLNGCSIESKGSRGDAGVPATPVQSRLPVSINDVMVALVNDAANPIWNAAWKEPQSEEDWEELERRSYQLELAGSLIATAGTGPLDAKWVAKPAWQQWAQQLRDTGADAVAAIENRDRTAISGIGDQLVEVCEGCHRDFKLPFPTRGKFGELAPVPDDPEGL